MVRYDTIKTKRDIFYGNVNLFGTQKIVNEALQDLASTFQTDLRSLNVASSPKGLVGGPFITTTNGNIFSSGLCQLIPEVETFKSFKTSCKIVLVIEKEAVFNSIKQNYGAISKIIGNFLFVTGKGYPCTATREFVKMLGENGLRVLGITDCDPFGIDIARVYKYGSKSMNYCKQRLICPAFQRIGLTLTDVNVWQISDDQKISLNSSDLQKIESLLRCDLDFEIRQELLIMKQIGVKYEIEALDHEFHLFFCLNYLPAKVQNAIH